MTKMLNARTLEIDDPGAAIADINAQLEAAGPLLANSAGFITCSYDFIESGMLPALCQALPFEVVGCTTLTTAANGEADTMQLCLSVLTSDDCTFTTIATAPLGQGNLYPPIKQAYDEAAARLAGPPSLVMVFAPMLLAVGGEQMLEALDMAAGGVPVFGTIGCDQDTSTYAHTYTLANCQTSRDTMALLLIHGPLDPKFFVVSTSEDKLQKQSAIITASEGSTVNTVNDMSTRDYLSTLGLIKGGGIEGMSSIPFLVDYNDGTQPVARAIYMLTEDGGAVCGGAMPLGATLSIGVLDYEDIMRTAEATTKTALATGKEGGLIFFPCLGRSLVLGADIYAETDQIAKAVGGKIPYHLAYSGGEICPVYSAEGHTVNRFHNFTLIACIF